MKAKQLRKGEWFEFTWSGLRARCLHKTRSSAYIEAAPKVVEGKKLPPARWHISLESEVSPCSK